MEKARTTHGEMGDATVSDVTEDYLLGKQRALVETGSSVVGGANQLLHADPTHVEVTHQDHLDQVGQSSPSRLHRLTNLVQQTTRRPKARGGVSSSPPRYNNKKNNNIRRDLSLTDPARMALETQSVSSDHDTVNSAEDLVSVSNFSVGCLSTTSNVTIKVSNKSKKPTMNKATSKIATTTISEGESPPKNKTQVRWSKIKKRIIGGKNAYESINATKSTTTSTELPRTPPSLTRRQSHSSGKHSGSSAPAALERRRLHSADAASSKFLDIERVRSSATSTPISGAGTGTNYNDQREYAILDSCIRGRLDGIDVISLGNAQNISHACDGPTSVSDPLDPAHSTEKNESSTSKSPWDDFPDFSFTGKNVCVTPAHLVSNMLWTSGGKQPPEMILEGYIPEDDRWNVRIEQRRKQSFPDAVATIPPSASSSNSSLPSDPKLPSQPQATAIEEYEILSSEDGSPILPTQNLWNNLWGPETAPINLAERKKLLDAVDHSESSNDMLLNLAAECSIPIDVDEDAFIVSTREHFLAIHELASVPISNGRFEAAIRIFEKLLAGLDLLTSEDKKTARGLMRGATLHNIGVLRMWQGHYRSSSTTFEQVVEERSRTLSNSHPDIAVSLARKALSLFALDRFEGSLKCLYQARNMLPVDSPSRAKLLNNIGVVRYHQQDYAAALNDFIKALEIQRLWLDEGVRRESIVYDTAVTLGNMGKLYLEQGDCDLAYYVYEEALLLQTTIFRKDSDLVLSSLMNLALAKAKNSQVKKALQILQGCTRSQNARFGPDSARAKETVGLMGFLYAREKSYEEALRCFRAIKKWQKNHLPPNHPSIQKTKEMIRSVEKSIGADISVWI